MKYQLTVYQIEDDSDELVIGPSHKVLFTKTLTDNDEKKNFALVRKAMSRSKSDGKVFAMVVERTTNDLPRAWRVDPYEKKQFLYGVEVTNTRTGEKSYEGDDGGGMEMLEWEQTPEGETAINHARWALDVDYNKVVDRTIGESKRSDKMKSAQKREPTPPKGKVKGVKDQTITIRLEPDDVKRVEALALMISEKTGVEITKSWVLRESFRAAHTLLKKKYEEM